MKMEYSMVSQKISTHAIVTKYLISCIFISLLRVILQKKTIQMASKS